MCWPRALIFSALQMLFFTATTTATAQAGWQEETHSQHVQVYSRAVAGSGVRELKSIVTVDADARKVAIFLQDADSNPRWVPHSQRVRVLAHEGLDVTWVHFLSDASWPFLARDAVARFELRQAPSSVIWIRFSSEPERLPGLKDTVRLRQYSGCWMLLPVAADKTRIEYLSHIEAGGRIPDWLANRVSVDATLQALENLWRQVPGYTADPQSPLNHLQAGVVSVDPLSVERDCDAVFSTREEQAR